MTLLIGWNDAFPNWLAPQLKNFTRHLLSPYILGCALVFPLIVLSLCWRRLPFALFYKTFNSGSYDQLSPGHLSSRRFP
jgi:hypothetical protein